VASRGRPAGHGDAAAPRRRGRRAPAPGALPAEGGDAPLAELDRDALSVFLYVALTPDEARAAVKELGLSVPGFRTEALSDVERCDLLADEVRARPEARAQVLELLRAAFGRLPLPSTPLGAEAASDLVAVASSEHGLTLALWRVLADPDPDVRARAGPALEQLVAEYYAPPGEQPEEAREGREGRDGEARALARAGDLEKELARAEERAEAGRRKAEEQREKLQDALREARARAAQAVDEAARARELAEAATAARERAEAALAAAQATDAAVEAQRARGAVRELEGKLKALESRLERQAFREADLAAALAQAEARSKAAGAQQAAAPPAEPAGEELEEAPASWLRPVYTREFYDSLEGWDLRIQRAAFKQANLLAQDHRHPSLRALPLEGLPGYYRVRVATDVRLLYRRGERQNEIEILSLIDREDLDRYVRQAKTR
jgi:DNA repair exonuclease SbcCD ATPase subunit